MFLRRHLQPIAAITRHPSLVYRVRRYFSLDASPLLIALRRARLHHADIVLCLLRIGTRHARKIAESLVGRPITIGPGCQFAYPSNRSSPLVRRAVTIASVSEGIIVRRRTRLFTCIPEFRVGRTLEQLQVRGITKGDVRRAVRRGLITLAERH